VNYPVDDTNNSCYYQQEDAPYIYFLNPNDLTSQKYCVKTCPTASMQQLRCSDQHPCKGTVSSYASSGVINNMGGFCEPSDESLNNKLWSNHILQDKLSLIGGYAAIMWSLAIGACIGLIYLIAVVLLPRMMTYLAFILAFAALLAGSIILLVQPIKLLQHDSNGWNLFLGIFFIVVSVVLLIFFFCYQQEIELASIFLNYANVLLK
jgi:hypothetical protein